MSGKNPPLPFDPLPQLPLYYGNKPGDYLYDDREYASTNSEENLSGEGKMSATPGVFTGARPFQPSFGYRSCETWTNFWLFLNRTSNTSLITGAISNTLDGLEYVLLVKTNLNQPSWTALQRLTASNSLTPFTVTNSGNYATLFLKAALSTNDVPPVIIVPPSNQVVYAGSPAVFSVTAEGSPAVSYQWQFDGTNIPGATSSTLTIANVQTNDVGLYTVIVSNIICTASAEAGLGLAWSNNLGSRFTASPAVGPDGTIYIANIKV